MARILAWLVAVSFFFLHTDIDAKAGGSGARSGGGSKVGHSTGRSSVSPGTGSNSSSHSVRGYTRKDGTYVQPHRQTNPDKNFRNNYSTKGNQNPNTGKQGSRMEPPKKK